MAQGGRASVLRFVPQSDLTTVDPVTTTAYITRHHALMVFDQLYRLDAQLKPQPQMVEGHTIEDAGKLWTFRLRDGLKFHDGEPVRGRDCIASIRRWAQRDSLGQALMARTDVMTTPDDRRFVIRLKRPYGLMLDTLAKLGPPALMIMPERLAMTDPAQQIPEVIGSGPFRFNPKERLVGARVVYDRNPDYGPCADGALSWGRPRESCRCYRILAWSRSGQGLPPDDASAHASRRYRVQGIAACCCGLGSTPCPCSTSS